MLVIRHQQLEILGSAAAAKHRLAQEQALAEDAASRGVIDANTFAREVVQAAWSRGLSSNEAVRQFAEIAAAHGTDWQTNPEKKWIAEALNDPGTSSPVERLRRAAKIAEHRRVVEEANQHAVNLFRGE